MARQPRKTEILYQAEQIEPEDETEETQPVTEPVVELILDEHSMSLEEGESAFLIPYNN